MRNFNLDLQIVWSCVNLKLDDAGNTDNKKINNSKHQILVTATVFRSYQVFGSRDIFQFFIIQDIAYCQSTTIIVVVYLGLSLIVFPFSKTDL